MMRSTMAYLVALEDGEIVKLTAGGFEPTGMFMVSSDGSPVSLETVRRSAQIAANA